MLSSKSIAVFVALISLTLATFFEDKPEGGIFQYQSSFHGPYGGTHIPFWEVGGAAIVADTYVRLTPNEQSQKGSIWSTRPLRHADWEIHLSIAVGSPNRLGADGMALWYLKERGMTGSVYGGPEKWEGLGIFFDTFDNDGKRDNPVVYAVYNDGTLTFDSGTDGKSHALGSCIAQIRQVNSNPEQRWIKFKVTYRSGELTLAYDLSEVNSAPPGYTDCFRARVSIPQTTNGMTAGYYLGLTAETGGLSDFHDVKVLTTWSFRPNTQNQNQPPPQQQQEDSQPVVQEPVQIHQAFQPPSQHQQQQDQQPWTGGDPVPQVMNQLQKLEQQEQHIVNSVESKLKQIEEKLNQFEKSHIDVLNKLQSSVEDVTQKISHTTTQEIREDLRSVVANVNNLQTRMNSLQALVEGTNRKTSDLHRLHETKSEEISSLVEKSSGWGFWTFFVIFQIFFAIAFVLWKRIQDEKSRKMF